MARPRASDHESKRAIILQRSAELFAAHGYDRASLSMLARACGMSKALLYHYYTDKAQLLFDIIHTHLQMNKQQKIEKLVQDYSRSISLKNIHNAAVIVVDNCKGERLAWEPCISLRLLRKFIRMPDFSSQVASAEVS